MNKRVMIAFGIFVLFVISLFVISAMITKQQKQPTTKEGTPTPISTKQGVTPIENILPSDYPYKLLSPTISMPLPNTGQNLFVTTTNPRDGETNVSVNKTLTITFNRTLALDEAIFDMIPQTAVTKRVSGNQLFISPVKKLQSKTMYIFSVLYSKGGSSRVFTFVTEGEGPVKIYAPDQSSKNTADNYDREHNPDLFLRNQIPYYESKFSITGDFSTQTGYYFFKVQLSGDKDQAKQTFITWLHKLGLKDDQIAKLDITYY